MELWIARDKDRSIYLHLSKPKRLESRGYFFSLQGRIGMNKREFPDVTWENSPKKVRIELIDDVIC